MINEGWIKLHRKIIDSDVFKDVTAFQIFIWLLLRADRRTGKTTIGRLWASKELKMKPSTFYKGMKRLQNIYKMIDLVTRKVTIKYTEVSLLNWHKYQDELSKVTQKSNNSVTIREQSSNTLQEVENRELRNNKAVKKPLKNNCPLKDKHSDCIGFLNKLALMKNLPHGWINYGKQISFLHKLIRFGYSFSDIKTEAKVLDRDNFMWDKWDLSTIANSFEKKGREVIIK